MNKADTYIALQADRVAAARQNVKAREEAASALDAVVLESIERRKVLAAHSAVLERLADVLGPKGIQHYIFTGVLKQLESIANSYLMVLAGGGIRLTLQGDEDVDKIIKSVLVRSGPSRVGVSSDAPDAFRERGLSQLSGGQWRRVSMSLDLAFAEVVRRRGVLRSNLIVMDEVLTHLDALGREAVGTVLRTMVDGPRGSDEEGGFSANRNQGSQKSESEEEAISTDDKNERIIFAQNTARALIGGGAYETAIVILQDLSAMELEEAFDHIDVVVKTADSAKLIVDGEI